MTLTKLINYKLWFLILGMAFSLFFVNSSYAQESTSSSEVAEKKFNISFPIAELGNCSSIESCKEYCSDPANQAACIAFAKQKGFYKNPSQGQGSAKMQEVIQKAKEELGCSTEKECREFCSQEANRDKCIGFAQKYGLKSLKSAVKNLVEKAVEFLGCDSEDECKSFCQQQTNFDKCAQFAKIAGLVSRGNTEGSGSGELKYMPNSQNAFEHANENARFCREYPDKCKNSSDSGNLKESFEKKMEQDKNRLEKKLENEKKEFERDQEKIKKEMEKRLEKSKNEFIREEEKIEDEIEDENEDDEEDEQDVRGVSTAPSFLDRVWHFFFK